MSGASFLAGKRVLVTGASGFFGSALVPRLFESGADVTCVSRRPQRGPHWLQYDLADAQAAAHAVAAARPHIIYHLTSDSRGGQELENVLPSLRNDVQATVNMLHAAACGASRVERFVMTTSMEEPRAEGGGEAIPASPYAAAKAASAVYARLFHALYRLPLVLLRPFMTYGPGQQPYKVIPSVIAALRRGEAPQLASGARKLDWVFIDDMAEAFMLAAERDVVGGTLDIGCGCLVSVRETVELIHRKMGGPAPKFGALSDRRMEVERAASTTEARERLGWTANTPLSRGLEKTIAELPC